VYDALIRLGSGHLSVQGSSDHGSALGNVQQSDSQGISVQGFESAVVTIGHDNALDEAAACDVRDVLSTDGKNFICSVQ